MAKQEVGINPIFQQKGGRNISCTFGEVCPLMNFQSATKILAERDYLSERVLKMEKVMAMAQAEIERLRQENQQLKKEKESLRFELKQLLGKIFKPRLKPKPDEHRPKRGAPCGHRGNSRKRPTEITEYIDVFPGHCDKCGSEVKIYPKKFDEHVIEDIEIRKKVTCFRLHYGYCPRCQQVVYLKNRSAIVPKARIGPQARALAGYLRYQALPYRKVAKVFDDVFDIKITHPSLLSFDTKQAENGQRVYEELKEKLRNSLYVHGDETGWRVQGENRWLWVFPNEAAVVYHIDKSRGHEVVEKILGKEYQGVIISDFYSAYNKLKASAKQRCVGHLLAEIKKIQEKNKFNTNSLEGRFCEDLKVILKETIEVWNEFHKGNRILKDLVEEKARAVNKIMELLLLPTEHKDIRRIRKRIIKHNEELFTFLDNPLIEPTNNRAERQLRPNVIMRKITFGNRSDLGAFNHVVIMSIIQTGVLNGIKPLEIFRVLSTKPLTSFSELPRPP